MTTSILVRVVAWSPSALQRSQGDSTVNEHPGSSGICADRAAASCANAEVPAGANIGLEFIEMTEAEARAKARSERMTLRKAHLGEPEADFDPVFGAEAIYLVSRLTRSSYSLAASPTPTYRADGITFDEAIADGQSFELEGRAIPVIGKAALLKNTRAAGREQDRREGARTNQVARGRAART